MFLLPDYGAAIKPGCVALLYNLFAVGQCVKALINLAAQINDVFKNYIAEFYYAVTPC